MQSNDLKKEIIRLLKEDEEFRYTIGGLIGYNTIIERLIEHDNKFNSIMEEIRDIKNVLAEHDNKFNYIMEEIRDIRKILAEHEKRFVSIETKVGELSIIIGSLGRRFGKGLEMLILNLYKDRLMEIGIDPSKARRYEFIDHEGIYGLKGKRYEFDIVVSNEHVDIIEVKSHIGEDDVVTFYEKVDSIRGLIIKEYNKIDRLIMVAVDLDYEALLKAREFDIKLVYGYVIPTINM